MLSKGTVVMIGLPGSGKTTFLAALWHQLESAEILTAFVADRLQPDREYLNSIRRTWLSFDEMPHTSAGIDRSALIHIRHLSSGGEFDLSIPDAAGERFARQWLDRELPSSYVDQLRQCLGVFLFVHNRQSEPAQVLPPNEVGNGSGPPMTEWDLALAPTQVRLVDLLQTALGNLERPTVLSVAVIVSAWDEVQDLITPRSWLQRRLPLLDQFLWANSDTLRAEIFGVSAIGGSLEQREELATTESPSARVRVEVDSEKTRDLTQPLKFLLVSDSQP